MGKLIADFIKDLFLGFLQAVADAVSVLVSYCLQNPFDTSSYIHFDWINTLLGYVQVIAFGIALAIRIFGAAREGLLSSFRAEPYGAAEWIFETVWVCGLICAAPAICVACAGFTMEVAHDITGIGSGTSLFSNFSGTITEIVNGTKFTGVGSAVAAAIMYVVMCGILLYYSMSVMLQCLKRQVLIIFLSVVLPIALCADSMRDKDFTRAMGALEVILYAGFISALQIIMLEAAFSIVVSLAATLDVFLVWGVISAALLGSIKALPEWLDKYMPSPVAAGNSGSRLGMMGAGMALRSLGSVGRGGRGFVAAAAKAAK